jgi:RING finger protein 121
MVPKLAATTPRQVYSFFLGVYKVSRTLGIIGYIFMLVEALGAGVLLSWALPQGTSIDCLWYGIYFGVLGRDCAEVASDWMASIVSRNLSARINDCGVCGGPLGDYSHLGNDEQKPDEATVQLSCKHCFHELCIKGWTMVGKKDMCPCCNEKVDLKELYQDRPWETRNLSWIQMLDMVRYLVVWNPLIFMVISFFFHFLAPHRPHGLHSAPFPPPSLQALGTNSTA